MNRITSFTDLTTWQKAHQLVVRIYKITKGFPKEEKYSLSEQMRRASLSITSNIAEGFSRRSKKEKIQFYFTAKGSITELQNQLLVARDVDYIEKDNFNDLANRTVEVHKLTNGLINSANSKY